MYSKQFGGKITKDLFEQYKQSPNWNNGKFQNIEDTSLHISLSKMPGIIYRQFTGKAEREPSKPLPVKPLNKTTFLQESETPKMVWYGHSVLLLRLHGKTLLIDPMLGPNASPIAPIATKRFSNNTLDLIDDLPEIDLLLLTHDHYDHLDYESIQKLKAKIKQYYVALGVKRHLVRWGISPDTITEFDWWDATYFNDIHITFTPTRHFSGRGISDRQKSLWGGWVFKTPKHNLWFSGDGGYGKHFKTIGEKLGPFDIAWMECGQYNEHWHQIHMYPEESIQAAIDANATTVMPVHWAGFTLAPHHWKEPVERFVAAAKQAAMEYFVPELGEVVELQEMISGNHSQTVTKEWWKQV
jgi:L-ascorbate metabolism protein UlaG (beta-lactamase superfamily)